MKCDLRRFSLLSVMLLASVNVGSAQPARKDPRASKPGRKFSVISLCEVVRDPSRYQNRIVRMNATYVASYHGAHLFGSQCNQPSMYVDPYIPCSGENGRNCQSLQKEFDNLVGPVRPGDGHADVVVVGRFRRVYRRFRIRNGTTLYRVGPNAGLRFELRISQIEPARRN